MKKHMRNKNILMVWKSEWTRTRVSEWLSVKNIRWANTFSRAVLMDEVKQMLQSVTKAIHLDKLLPFSEFHFVDLFAWKKSLLHYTLFELTMFPNLLLFSTDYLHDHMKTHTFTLTQIYYVCGSIFLWILFCALICNCKWNPFVNEIK